MPRDLEWWGPTEAGEGWHLRVPVTVESGMDGSVDNLPTVAEIDLGNVTRQAGWLTIDVAGREVLESFTLDTSSIRVVEYTNFQLPRVRSTDAQPLEVDDDLPTPEAYTLPVDVEKGFWDSPSSGPFDPTGNPSVTLRWIMPGTTESDETRHFVVYFDVEENGGTPAQDEDRLAESGLDGLDWIGRGTSVVGSGPHVWVTALHDRTNVQMHLYQQRTPVPVSEPVELASGETRQLTDPNGDEPWLVTGDGPIVASSHREFTFDGRPFSSETGFFPSWDGTLLGTRWDLPTGTDDVVVYNPNQNPANVRMGGQSAFIQSGGARVFNGAAANGWLQAEASDPVLVQGRNEEDAQHPFVSGTGGPTGDRLFGLIEGRQMASSNSNRAEDPQVHPLRTTSLGQRGALFQLETLNEQDRVLPPGGPGVDRAGEEVRKAPEWLTYQPGSDKAVGPLRLNVLDPDDPGQPPEAPSVVALGGPLREITTTTGPAEVSSPLGGLDARVFSSPSPVNVFAWHDNTEITVTTGAGDAERFALDRHQRGAVSEAPLTVEATKPVAVVPDAQTSYGAGNLRAVNVQTGDAQHRGPLVSLTPAGDQEPVVRSISFGEEATFELIAENRGRTADGSPLPDVADAWIPEPPPGWTATLEPNQTALAPDGSERFTLRVQAPETRGAGDQLTLPVRVASQANTNMTDEVTTITLLREDRGVGMWFEQENGPRELTMRFQPGQTRGVPVVVKNTGSTKDTFRLTVANVETGWDARFTEDDEVVRSIELESGSSKELALRVEPPSPGSVPIPSSLSLAATSTNDTTVSAKTLLDGLVATESNLELTTDEPVVIARPGDDVEIPVHLHNHGETSQDVQLDATGDLPPAWPTPEFLFRGDSLAPVGNRLNSVSPTSEEGVPLTLTLHIPPTAEGGVATSLMAEARATGVSSGEPDLLPLNLHVEPFISLEQDPLTTLNVPPGGAQRQAITLTNQGNIDADLTLQPVRLPSGLEVKAPSNLTIPSGANTSFDIEVHAPPSSPPRDEMIEILLLDQHGATDLLEIPIAIPHQARITSEETNAQRIVAGITTTYQIKVENVGNAASDASVDVTGPSDWTLRADPQVLQLDPQEQGSLELEIHPPKDATSPAQIDVILEEDGVPREPATLLINPVEADFGIEETALLSEPPLEGEAMAIRASLANHANVTTLNVSATIMDSGEVISSTTVDRIPPNSVRTVVMTVPSEPGARSVQVVLDPLEEIPEVDRSDNTDPVDLSGAPQEAPLGPWTSLAATFVATILLAPSRNRWRGESRLRG